MHLTLIIFTAWLVYMFFASQWHLFLTHWMMALVMAGGSFIAGASPESGGAFAFPVMTLFYDIQPDAIRNFSFAVQSIGMTAASFFIFRKKIPVDKKYLYFSITGGTAGVIIGTLFLNDKWSPEYLKMLFFSFWLSFGFVLFYLNHIKKRDVKENLPALDRPQKSILILVGAIGGALTSVLGSGIDIFTFSYVTMRYNLSEKVATPTSVIIMASNSIVGFLMRFFIHNDIGSREFQMLTACIPVVIFGAPLGVYFVNKIKRTQIANFLYIILLAQFIIAWTLINPRGELLTFSIIVFISGIIIFSYFGKIILLAEVLKKLLVPERFLGRTFAWDANKAVGFDIGMGFWKNILERKKLFLILICLWFLSIVFYTEGNVLTLLESPIPLIIITISIIASVIANSTAAGGGIIFLPAFSAIFLVFLDKIDPAQSYFSQQTYTLAGIVIAIHVTQAFGMLAGSVSWWSSGVKILLRENLYNIAGVIIGVIAGKYYFTAGEEIIYKTFGLMNLIMSFIVTYNLFIIKNIPTREIWPKKLSWIFFLVGITGGLVSAWTGVGIGSLTSFILILWLKPEIGIANGSVIMALTSITTVIVHLFLDQTIPVEIILFTIPAVILGGYAAPFFNIWVGKKFYILSMKMKQFFYFNANGEKIDKYILEYTFGQMVMSVSFIIVCLYNGIYFLFLN